MNLVVISLTPSLVWPSSQFSTLCFGVNAVDKVNRTTSYYPGLELALSNV